MTLNRYNRCLYREGPAATHLRKDLDATLRPYLTHGVERAILAAAGASAARDTCVAILEGLAREWTRARAAYTAGRVGFWLDTVRRI